jgi:hypothetical protein
MVERELTSEIGVETSLSERPSLELRPVAREVVEVLRDLGHSAALYEGALRALATIAPPVRERMAAFAMRELLDELEVAARVGSKTPGRGVRTDALAERWRPMRAADGTLQVTQAMIEAVDGFLRDRSTLREDVKRTLQRWPNPNTRRKNRSILVSFYDWAMQELDPPRDNNPARQTRPPKSRKPQVYRMTRAEVVAFLGAAATRRERRIAYLGVCAGIRSYELRHLQRRHFERPGWVQISADIAKGGRERWVPVLPKLEPVVAESMASRGDRLGSRSACMGRRVCDPRRTVARPRREHAADGSQAQAGVPAGAPDGRHAARPARWHSRASDAALDAARLRRPRRLACRDQERAGAARPRRRRDDADLHRGADARRAHGRDRGDRFGLTRTDVPVDHSNPREAPTGIEPVYTALQAAA